MGHDEEEGGGAAVLGVMTVRKEELKFREFDRYRAFYCGLCRSIGTRCGGLCRMALSFEMTFLAMLLTALYESETAQEARRCAFHPVHRRQMLRNDAIDYCADLSAMTGEMLAELFVMREDVYGDDLREMGYYLGKYIYLCDCYEDIERDEKKKSYNPLLSRKDQPEFDACCAQMLSDMMARAARAFERLPILQDAEIMRNILYSGIWLRFENAGNRRKANRTT